MDDIVTQLYSPPVSISTVDSSRNTSILTRNRNFITSDSNSSNRKPRCLLACSGSVATVKVPELAVRLSQYFEMLIVCTQNAMFFLQRAETYNPGMWQQFLAIGGMDLVLEDKDEWDMWNKIGHDILHIDLRRWADVLVVAPASANLIAKASVGICDNLLLSLLRAWELRKRPCLLCPAMNTVMWEHPSTSPALATLQAWGWKIVGPVEKMLACKEVGSGAMAHVEDIVHATRRALEPLHNIAPYLADEDTSFSSPNVLDNTSTNVPANGKDVIMNNIPHQVWRGKLEQQLEIETAHKSALEVKIQEEINKQTQLQNQSKEQLDKLFLTVKMIAVPAILLIWGTLQKLHSIKQ